MDDNVTQPSSSLITDARIVASPAPLEINVPPKTAIPIPTPPANCLPRRHDHRSVILCFDGTGDQFDKDNSNVVDFFSMLKKDDRTQQIVYYQPGIGTYIGRHGTADNWGNKARCLWDQAVAWNLDDHVKEGYNFLMQNYIAGDRIHLFGFSRGAYTARALAGMLHKVGLLPPGNEEQIPFAYKMFKNKDRKSWKQADAFKDAFAIDVKIHFLGVWDTVRSVGLLDFELPFSTSNNSIRYFRHAVALDEHRVKFKANHWNPPSSEERQLGTKYEEEDTDVREVWFAGVHTDIGGGSVQNGTLYSLAKITLRWMIKECFRCDTGIMFDANKLFSKTALTEYHLTSPVLDISEYSNKAIKVMEDREEQKDLEEDLDDSKRSCEKDDYNHFSESSDDDRTHVSPSPTHSRLVSSNKPAHFHKPSTLTANTHTMPPSVPFPVHIPHPKTSIHIPHRKETEIYFRECLDLKEEGHDQLAVKLSWWILEWLPLHCSLPKHDVSHDKPFRGLRRFIKEHPINRGRGRKIPVFDANADRVEKILVHHTVNERIKNKNYTPRAKNWAEVVDMITWTD